MNDPFKIENLTGCLNAGPQFYHLPIGHTNKPDDWRDDFLLWIYEGELRLEYQETLLAQYQSVYDRRQRRLQDVSQPTVYQTPFASPHLEMFELDDEQWVKIRRRAYQRQQRRITRMARQLSLSDIEIAV